MMHTRSHPEGDLDQISQALQHVQGQPGPTWEALQAEAHTLATLEDRTVASALQRWVFECPAATLLLLDAVAQVPALSVHLTPALLRLAELASIHPDFRGRAAAILQHAASTLSPAMAQVADSLYGPSPADDGAAADPDWPDAQNFPPLDTIAGRQARLRYLGHGLQDDLGTWGVSSEAALIRYQIDAELPVLGHWGEETSAALDEEAFGKMCMHRSDPSTVFA